MSVHAATRRQDQALQASIETSPPVTTAALCQTGAHQCGKLAYTSCGCGRVEPSAHTHSWCTGTCDAPRGASHVQRAALQGTGQHARPPAAPHASERRRPMPTLAEAPRPRPAWPLRSRRLWRRWRRWQQRRRRRRPSTSQRAAVQAVGRGGFNRRQACRASGHRSLTAGMRDWH